MQLDFQQFLNKLEKLTDLRSVQHFSVGFFRIILVDVSYSVSLSHAAFQHLRCLIIAVVRLVRIFCLLKLIFLPGAGDIAHSQLCLKSTFDVDRLGLLRGSILVTYKVTS